MAKLIIESKDYGVHAFIVQTRSLDDFKPRPGVELRDIGYFLSSPFLLSCELTD